MKSFFLSKKKVLKLKILYNVKTFLTSFQIIIYFYFLYEKISFIIWETMSININMVLAVPSSCNSASTKL